MGRSGRDSLAIRCKTPIFGDYVMMPSRRRPVNKSKSARKFRSQIGRTKAVNVRPGLARGGLRL